MIVTCDSISSFYLAFEIFNLNFSSSLLTSAYTGRWEILLHKRRILSHHSIIKHDLNGCWGELMLVDLAKLYLDDEKNLPSLLLIACLSNSRTFEALKKKVFYCFLYFT